MKWMQKLIRFMFKCTHSCQLGNVKSLSISPAGSYNLSLPASPSSDRKHLCIRDGSSFLDSEGCCCCCSIPSEEKIFLFFVGREVTSRAYIQKNDRWRLVGDNATEKGKSFTGTFQLWIHYVYIDNSLKKILCPDKSVLIFVSCSDCISHNFWSLGRE